MDDGDPGPPMGMSVGEALEFSLKEEDYKTFFKSMLDKEGIKSIGDLDDEKKKAFFNKVDAAWKAKGETKANESLSEKGEYQVFFRKMMDKEGVTGIAKLPPEKKSEFFRKINGE